MQRYLALSSESRYVYQSRIPAFSPEYSIRQEILEKPSTQRFLSIFSAIRFSDNRSICFLPVTSNNSMYSLTFRCIHSGDRCNDTNLEHGSSLCISSLQYDFKKAPKNKIGMCSSPNSNSTSLEYPTMVPRSSLLRDQCPYHREKEFW